MRRLEVVTQAAHVERRCWDAHDTLRPLCGERGQLVVMVDAIEDVTCAACLAMAKVPSASRAPGGTA